MHEVTRLTTSNVKIVPSFNHVSRYFHCFRSVNTNLEPYYGLLSLSSILNKSNIKELSRPHASGLRRCSRKTSCGARGVMGVSHSKFRVPPSNREAPRSLSTLKVTEPGDEACLQVCS